MASKPTVCSSGVREGPSTPAWTVHQDQLSFGAGKFRLAAWGAHHPGDAPEPCRAVAGSLDLAIGEPVGERSTITRWTTPEQPH